MANNLENRLQNFSPRGLDNDFPMLQANVQQNCSLCNSAPEQPSFANIENEKAKRQGSQRSGTMAGYAGNALSN